MKVPAEIRDTFWILYEDDCKNYHYILYKIVQHKIGCKISVGIFEWSQKGGARLSNETSTLIIMFNKVIRNIFINYCNLLNFTWIKCIYWKQFINMKIWMFMGVCYFLYRYLNKKLIIYNLKKKWRNNLSSIIK